ncbi:MAG: Flp family type IVb pilin [Xanthomonas perforans]|uniref:Flp family type IVb pilin n=1 Tax=Xanthomonas perforans TaxID=442694 RepID=A0A6P0E7W7_XANPE|nr:Flp family type IVb pilin [Xanthomonas perforans]NEL40492.1 Flp family type IVb pilin [Xanthomonas perforans]NEL74367.1 Flp family type IVb pilin [Xanthomonas perforans]NEL79076.1 Flp family type IVb pilin [Xanthomonas perforans]NEM13052.1 Flp family type IVb pilin [Xanthomonas perforans]
MRAFLVHARMLWRDRRGATAIEYGLILALIVLVLITSLRALAGTTTTMWNDIAAEVLRSTSRP